MGIVQRFTDGLINVMTGAGTTTDPRSYQHYRAGYMSDVQIDQAYRASWIIRKAIEKPATEMVREWRDWQAESADIAALESEEKRLDLRNKIKHAEILRGLGGGGMVMWIKGQDPALPLDPTTIKAGDLQTIHVWHRSRFSLGPMIEVWDDPWFGHPSFYQVSLQGSVGSQIKFHPSRVVAFKADHVGDIVGAPMMDWFWGQSKVQTILDAAQNVDTAENGFAALIKDARNRRIYIPKLLEMVSTSAGEANLAKRLQAFALGESSNSVSWLEGGDGEGKGAERIEDRQMVWAGMPDIMNAYRTAMAAAADMPVTVLWGTSPAGLNATGESDLMLFEKAIKARQDLDLRPCMTQIDAALLPSALGQVDDSIWYDWAPLSTQSELETSTTLWNTMQGVEILAGLNLIPDVALSKGVQNLLSERGWIPGLDDALAEIPENQRFPELEQPGATDPDPSALVATGDPLTVKGGDPLSGRAPAQPIEAVARRRAANDARFLDATPRTLYVRRDVVNVTDIRKWATAQGFTDIVPDLHVTIAYSTTPVDWMKVGSSWSSKLEIGVGGPRLVESLGPDGKYAALLFTADELVWRNQAIRDAGASWSWPDYQPHISIQIGGDFDLSKVKPYTGKIVLGPEIFEEVRTDDPTEDD